VWEKVFQSDKEAVPYQSPAWFESALTAGHFKDASRFYELDNGKQLIMPMVRSSNIPEHLATAGSMPEGWGMGGLISESAITIEDIKAVFVDLKKLPYLQVKVRPNPHLGELWKQAAPDGVVKTSRLAHILDLDGGFDQVWNKRFSQQTRRAVRKAEARGVTVEQDTTGKLISVFYDLWRLSIERWAEHQHEPLALARWRGERRDPLHKFETVAQTLKDHCCVWVARVNGKPAASILVLQYGNVNYSRGAMDKDLADETNANSLLHMMAIKDACEKGCHYYHMGESGNSSGLHQFKSRLGAEGFPYEEYSIDRLPISKVDKTMRTVVKRLIGFKD
jgi:lipid II:glycine glycyltransferase (peptidoglycan interpeptide bridge formation enzyme)